MYMLQTQISVWKWRIDKFQKRTYTPQQKGVNISRYLYVSNPITFIHAGYDKSTTADIILMQQRCLDMTGVVLFCRRPV